LDREPAVLGHVAAQGNTWDVAVQVECLWGQTGQLLDAAAAGGRRCVQNGTASAIEASKGLRAGLRFGFFDQLG
jgi:hypothetical protein